MLSGIGSTNGTILIVGGNIQQTIFASQSRA